VCKTPRAVSAALLGGDLNIRDEEAGKGGAGVKGLASDRCESLRWGSKNGAPLPVFHTFLQEFCRYLGTSHV
jgi:hypothetical protein